jgi:hypothetical protein
MTYTIPVTGYAWAAGTYTSTLTNGLTSIGIGQSITGPGLFTLTIPAFMAAPATIPSVTLAVNNLAYYSSQTVTAQAPVAISATVPYKIALNGNSSSFSYSNTLGLSTPANLILTNVQANLNGGSAINLSGSAQSLTATAVPVSGGNNQTQALNFSITPGNLVSQFVQTGTYSVPVTLTVSDGRSVPTLSNQTITSTLIVNVSDMQAFSVNDASTTLNLATVANYQGISQAQPNHMTVSSTSPWSIGVSTGSSNLTNGGNTIPVNYISVGNTTGEAFLTTTALSTTAQTLTASQPPAIAKIIGVNYSISAANAQQLIGKASGTYSVTVTYTLSAL